MTDLKTQAEPAALKKGGPGFGGPEGESTSASVVSVFSEWNIYEYMNIYDLIIRNVGHAFRNMEIMENRQWETPDFWRPTIVAW